jgi:hypothetical protein
MAGCRGELPVVRPDVKAGATMLYRAGPGKPQIASQCIQGTIPNLELSEEL